MKKRNLLNFSCVFVIILLLVTGCGKNNAESNVNSKVTSFKEIIEGYAKEKGLKIGEDIYDEHSLKIMNCTYAINYQADNYSIEVFQFPDEDSLNKEYDKQIIFQKSISSRIDILEENDNLFEIITTIEPGKDAPKLEKTNYNYMLYIKSEKEYIVLYEVSTSTDKENIKKIGKEIKDLIQTGTRK